MAISISKLSQAEFINLCKQNKMALKSMFAGMSIRSLMELRRDIQIALTHFARAKPVLTAIPNGSDMMDLSRSSHEIQLRALALYQYIENRCRNKFIRWKTPKVIQQFPWLVTNPQKVKSIAKQEWQSYCAKHSY